MLTPSQRLWGAAVCGVIYTLALLWATGVYSLSLLWGNLAHMAIHMVGLLLALLVDIVAQRLPEKEKRVKALGAFISVMVLVVIAGGALWQIAQGEFHDHETEVLLGSTEVHQHFAPHLAERLAEMPSLLVVGVASFGLLLHLVSFFLLRGGRRTCVNVHAAYVHLRFDLVLTLFTLVAGALMYAYSLPWLDRAVIPLIVLLVVFSLFEVGGHAYKSVKSAGHHHHH